MHCIDSIATLQRGRVLRGQRWLGSLRGGHGSSTNGDYQSFPRRNWSVHSLSRGLPLPTPVPWVPNERIGDGADGVSARAHAKGAYGHGTRKRAPQKLAPLPAEHVRRWARARNFCAASLR